MNLVNKYISEKGDKFVIDKNLIREDLNEFSIMPFIKIIETSPKEIISKAYIETLSVAVTELCKYEIYKIAETLEEHQLDEAILCDKNRKELYSMLTTFPGVNDLTNNFNHEEFWKSIKNPGLLSYFMSLFTMELIYEECGKGNFIIGVSSV